MNKSNYKKIIPYGHQWIDDSDIAEVVKVLKSDWLTQGPKVQEFEENLARVCGCKFAVVLNSGTSALHASYFAINLKKGNEFITSPNTFVATANAGLYLDLKPVFVDVEEDTGNINIDKIEKKITEKTKLIVPVHYAGHPVNMEKLYKIANKYNLYIVEDACHALGSKYREYKTGSCEYSHMAVLSFHPVKHITTGEGGAVLTNNREFYEKLLMFRNHGITKKRNKLINQVEGMWYHEMHYLGHNYRITDIQAVLGISQLKRLDIFIEKRREIVHIYRESFGINPYFDIPEEKDYVYSSWHLYPIKLKDKYKKRKKEIFLKMREKELGVQVHYIPVYWQPYYRELGYKIGICPNAEDFYQREISIPLYQSMNKNDAKYVINTVFKVFKDT